MKSVLALSCVLGISATASAGLMETFDVSGLPAGWTSVDVIQVGGPSNAIGWDTNDNIFDEGVPRGNIATGDTFSIVIDSDATGGFPNSGEYDVALVSPSFAVDAANSILQFEHLYRQLGSDITEQASVEITIDGGTNWINLITYTSSQFGTFANADPTINQDAGTSESLDLSTYLGETAQIRFRYTNTNFNAWDWYWQIDNIQTVPAPGALALLGLAALRRRRRG